jgi:hypothetical protein
VAASVLVGFGSKPCRRVRHAKEENLALIGKGVETAHDFLNSYDMFARALLRHEKDGASRSEHVFVPCSWMDDERTPDSRESVCSLDPQGHTGTEHSAGLSTWRASCSQYYQATKPTARLSMMWKLVWEMKCSRVSVANKFVLKWVSAERTWPSCQPQPSATLSSQSHFLDNFRGQFP